MGMMDTQRLKGKRCGNVRARAELGTDYEEGGNDYLTNAGSDSTDEVRARCGKCGNGRAGEDRPNSVKWRSPDSHQI